MNSFWKVEIIAPYEVGGPYDWVPAPWTRVEIVFCLCPDVLYDPLSKYHYYCKSCYATVGNKEDVFRTSSEYSESMVKIPTSLQQGQMAQHAKQHSIMWKWVRGMEK